MNPKTFQREMTKLFEAEALSNFRYYRYPSGLYPLENLNQIWTSPKWGKTKVVETMFGANSSFYYHYYYYFY